MLKSSLRQEIALKDERVALDICEPVVIRALEKDGWRIINKPHRLRTGNRVVYADFSLQRANNGHSEFIIICEVKCFANPDADLAEFYTSVGQYKVYQSAIRAGKVDYPLYLAMPHAAYERLIEDTILQHLLNELRVKIILVDLQEEVVTRWITWTNE
jgi:hypothetical protein